MLATYALLPFLAGQILTDSSTTLVRFENKTFSRRVYVDSEEKWRKRDALLQHRVNARK
jgi:hypothetical protein